jgi:hypothetical protein
MTRLEAAAREFLKKNPQVYPLFCHLVQKKIDEGHMRLGVSVIWEDLRWEGIKKTESDDGFKLNNDHRAYIARIWLSEHPEYPEFFELRRVRGENGNGDGENGNGNGDGPHFDDDGQGRLF